MSEWIPVAEKLIDLGYYWVTMQFLEQLTRNISIIAFMGILVFAALFIGTKISKAMD